MLDCDIKLFPQTIHFSQMSIRIHCTIRQDQPFVRLQIHPGKALTHINIMTSDITSCSESLDNLKQMLYQLLLQKNVNFVTLV